MPAPTRKPAVLHVLEATEGGTKRHVCDLLPLLAARGYAVTLAASFLRNPAAAEDMAPLFAKHGLPILEFPMRRAILPLTDLISAARLTRLVRRLKPDILHTHSSKAGFLGRLAGSWGGIPVVHTPHAFPFLMEGGGMKKKFYFFLERMIQRKTAALIAVSQEEAQAARRLGYPPERIHYIPNGSRGRSPSTPDIEGERPREPSLLSVGFFGRLTRQKGGGLLLRAAAGLDVELRIHGRGEDEDALRKQCQILGISQRVHFMGECAQDEVVDNMRACSVIVVPSRWEGCPYVVLDAFAAGVPVIAVRVGGIPDLIRDGINGVLVPPDDAQALAGAIAALLKNPSQRHALAAAAQECLAHHTIDEMVDKVDRVYTTLSFRPSPILAESL